MSIVRTEKSCIWYGRVWVHSWPYLCKSHPGGRLDQELANQNSATMCTCRSLLNHTKVVGLYMLRPSCYYESCWGFETRNWPIYTYNLIIASKNAPPIIIWPMTAHLLSYLCPILRGLSCRHPSQCGKASHRWKWLPQTLLSNTSRYQRSHWRRKGCRTLTGRDVWEEERTEGGKERGREGKGGKERNRERE